MERAQVLLAALITEAALGFPARWAKYHPVTWVGRLIGTLDAGWNRGRARRWRGIATIALVVAAAALAGWMIERALSGIWGAALLIFVATVGIAQRSLHDHVRAVAMALTRQGVAAGRASVSRIVGRDVVALDDGGVARAAIESLAESFGDGVVAPAFWFLIGGLPGLFVYKAANTADSMIGHLSERHRDFGWATARLDDLLNLVPARIGGLLICIAGKGGGRTMLRYAPRHASPNGGWPEAAMAGVLHLRLGGPVSYDGEPAMRAWLGDGVDPAGAPDIVRALAIYRCACLLLWLGIGGVAWLAL
jgi:adenosylcobinamide-phosphate synthase